MTSLGDNSLDTHRPRCPLAFFSAWRVGDPGMDHPRPASSPTRICASVGVRVRVRVRVRVGRGAWGVRRERGSWVVGRGRRAPSTSGRRMRAPPPRRRIGQATTTASMLPVPRPSTKETALSTKKLNRMAAALARALRMDEINQLGRETGQSARLRTVTPFRLFLSITTALADGDVESLADLLREFNHHNGASVAYKPFYNRLARPGFAKFMRKMLERLLERLSVQALAPEGHAAVARFKDIVIHDRGSRCP